MCFTIIFREIILYVIFIKNYIFRERGDKRYSSYKQIEKNARSRASLSLLSSSSDVLFLVHLHFKTQQKGRQSCYSLFINEKPNRHYSISFSSFIPFSSLRRRVGLKRTCWYWPVFILQDECVWGRHLRAYKQASVMVLPLFELRLSRSRRAPADSRLIVWVKATAYSSYNSYSSWRSSGRCAIET